MLKTRIFYEMNTIQKLMKNYLLIIETEQSEVKPDQSNNAVELQWRHNDRHGVSNNQPHDCLLNGLFRRKSKKTSELRITGFVKGIHRWPVNSPQPEPVTRKMFSFDDVIMISADKKWLVRSWLITFTMSHGLK